MSKGGTRQEAASGVLSIECDWFSVMGNFVRQQLMAKYLMNGDLHGCIQVETAAMQIGVCMPWHYFLG